MSEQNQVNPQSFELPKPLEAAADKQESSAAANPENVGEKTQATPAPMPLVDPSQLTQSLNPVPDDSGGSSDDSNAALAADDADLIEKEWVQKAKKIIERTSDDPHAQKKELSQFSADYLKKRYGKDIAVDDSL